MSEVRKRLINGRMLKSNGNWLYCDACGKTVGYLCYTTYQQFYLEFACRCGNSGAFHLQYPGGTPAKPSAAKLKLKKNRFCCPADDAPLFTVVEKHIERWRYSVTCKDYGTEYRGPVNEPE